MIYISKDLVLAHASWPFRLGVSSRNSSGLWLTLEKDHDAPHPYLNASNKKQHATFAYVLPASKVGWRSISTSKGEAILISQGEQLVFSKLIKLTSTYFLCFKIFF